jgi:hypothetical protein
VLVRVGVLLLAGVSMYALMIVALVGWFCHRSFLSVFFFFSVCAAWLKCSAFVRDQGIKIKVKSRNDTSIDNRKKDDTPDAFSE